MTSVEKNGMLLSTKQMPSLEPRADYVTTKRWFMVSCIPVEVDECNMSCDRQIIEKWMKVLLELSGTASKCLLCRVNNAEKLYKANGDIDGMDDDMKKMEAKAFSI